MSTSGIKTLVWVAALAAGGYLGWFVWDFLEFKKAGGLRPKVGEERQREVLDNIPDIEEQKAELVPYGTVLATIKDLDWIGKPPPPPAPPKGPDKLVVAPVKSIDKILSVQAIVFDGYDRSRSQAFVEYIDSTDGQLMVAKENVLFEGDRLPSKATEHITVARIEPSFVEFSFDDEEREPERLVPPELKESLAMIPKVGPDGVRVPEPSIFIPVNQNYQRFEPKKTQEIGQGVYIIGTEDAQYFEQNYTTILSDEVQTSRYRDPRTGRYAGIQINKIKPGSIAEAHGAREGDVIKSINGEAVTSQEEALRFVKANASTTVKWEVVVENLGRERTLSFETPADD